MSEYPEITRKTGVLYARMLLIAREMKEHGESAEDIADFCMSCMEAILCDGISSTNFKNKLIIQSFYDTIDAARDRYDDAKEKKKEAQYFNGRYEDIANRYLHGETQRQIAEAIGVSLSTINRRLVDIKKNYPYLLNGGDKN